MKKRIDVGLQTLNAHLNLAALLGESPARLLKTINQGWMIVTYKSIEK
jgi:hypothetical protein